MKNKHIEKIISLILAVLFAVSIFTGCSGGKNEDEDNSQEDLAMGDALLSSSTAAIADDRFTLRYNRNETLNPIRCDNIYNDAITSLMYEGLFRLDEEFRPVNVLCSEYSTDDGQIYIFKIIDAKMHDGRALTTEDVAYSINQARGSSRYGVRLRNIAYCGLTENGSLWVQLYTPDYSLPALLDVPIIRNGSGESDAPAGTGPYYFNSISGNPGLSPFKSYHGTGEIPLERIYLEEIGDGAVEESFTNYKLDCICEDTANGTTINLYSDHEARYYDTSVLQYVGFNSHTPVLRDQNMRLAISYAVNREQIVNEVYDGDGRAATLLLNPAHYLYSEEWETDRGYSPAKMSSYLAASGLDDKNSDGYLEYPVNGEYQFFELRFLVCSDNKKKVEAAEQIAENLRSVGLRIVMVKLPWSSYWSALINGEFDLYYSEVALTRNFDFCSLLEPEGSLDYGEFGSEKGAEYCMGFLNAVSEEEKAAAAESLCSYVSDNALIVPVMYRQYAVYTHRGVLSGFSPTVSGVFGDAAYWTVHLKDEE